MKGYHHIQPSIRIGKQGITPGVIAEIKKQLKAYGVIKIKMLPTFMAEGKARKEQGRELAKEAGAVLVSAIGGVVVLEKLEKD